MTLWHVHFTTTRGGGLPDSIDGLAVHPAEKCRCSWGIKAPGHLRTAEDKTARGALEKALGVSRSRAERMLASCREAAPPVITPEEFSRRMAGLKIRYEVGDLDRETAHRKADDLLCQVLVGLGYDDGVEVYDAILKRY